MKKKILILITVMIFIPTTAYATGGGLRKSSIKTCPDGVTYGLHSDGNGGTHWHRAAHNDNNYYAVGDAIYSDPCPGYTKNGGTAQHTIGGSSSSDNNSGYSSKNYSQAQQEKSNDTSLKSVKVNDTYVEISDDMQVDSEKKKASIRVETNNYKAKAEVENRDLVAGENIFDILVTAENGEQKTYKLTINKLTKNGSAKITYLNIGGSEITFNSDNEAELSILSEGKTLNYEYRLSKYNGSMKVLLNDTEVNELKNIKYNDTIKLIVLDEEDNETIYTVHIKNTSGEDIIITIITALIMLFLFIALPIIIIVKIVKRKKTS